MASSLNALPTLTATALGASLATGLAAGQYKAPTVTVGLQVPVDSLNFYIQAQDQSTAIVNVTATATSTQNSGDQTNTWHKGTMLYWNITTVAATATFGLNLQVKDPVSGLYVTTNRVSLDSQTGASTNVIHIYPGGPNVAASFTGANVIAAWNQMLPQTYRVQVSVTATASAGGASNTFTVSQSKVL